MLYSLATNRFVRNAGKHSLLYGLLKMMVKAAFYVFYRNVVVTGREKVPEDGPLIFAANHQNALMDPLAVIVTTDRQPVFLARSDIFKNPIKAKILRFLRIMPVYRISDGIETLQENREIFSSMEEILKMGGSIGIMPEGTHGKMKRLRPLKKGVFRIALESEKGIKNLNVRIVPVGIDFSNHYLFREDISVSFGNPLQVSDYIPLYEENPVKAIARMRDDLSEELSSLIVNIRNRKLYDRYELMLNIAVKTTVRSKKKKISSRIKFETERRIAQIINESEADGLPWFKELSELTGRLRSQLDESGFTPEALEKSKSMTLTTLRFLGYLLSFPFFAAGVAAHIIPLLIIDLSLRKITDPQFISSYKFVLGVFLVPLNYLLLAAVLSHFLSPVVVVSMVLFFFLAGLFAAEYKKRFSVFISGLRFLLKKRRRTEDVSAMQEMYGRVLILLRPLLEKL